MTTLVSIMLYAGSAVMCGIVGVMAKEERDGRQGRTAVILTLTVFLMAAGLQVFG